MGNHVTWAAVRDLAYRLWEERGRPEGRSEELWYEAERQLQGREQPSKGVDEAIRESFPASDAPASGLPDKPPANADEKWASAAKKPRTRRSAAARSVSSDAREKKEVPKVGSRDAPGG